MGWRNEWGGDLPPGTVLTLPDDDVIEHSGDPDGDCVCGPRIEPVDRDDGSMGWSVVHHSLDGREATE